MQGFIQAVGAVVVVVALVIFIGLLLALPLAILWNGCVVPAIPGVQEITWLQAWGILIVSNILFKSTTYKKD